MTSGNLTPSSSSDAKARVSSQFPPPLPAQKGSSPNIPLHALINLALFPGIGTILSGAPLLGTLQLLLAAAALWFGFGSAQLVLSGFLTSGPGLNAIVSLASDPSIVEASHRVLLAMVLLLSAYCWSAASVCFVPRRQPPK